MAGECFALIYFDPATPTVRAWCMRSAVLVTHRLAAPMSSSSAEAMTARQMRSMVRQPRGRGIVPLTMQATASRYSETVYPGAAPALGGGRDDRSRLPPARSGVEKAGVD